MIKRIWWYLKAQYSHHPNHQNDYITIRVSWLNQGTADAGQFRVILEDLTEGVIIYDGIRQSLGAGMIDSLTIPHQFSNTETIV